jgi:hypothetical protein
MIDRERQREREREREREITSNFSLSAFRTSIECRNSFTLASALESKDYTQKQMLNRIFTNDIITMHDVLAARRTNT